MLIAAARRRGRGAGGGGGGGGSNLRTAPSPEWAFMLGPQAIPSYRPDEFTAASMTQMNTELGARLTLFRDRLTEIAGFVSAAGTVSVANGSSTITGVGTAFGTGALVAGNGIRIRDAAAGNVWRYYIIHATPSATQLVLATPEDGGVDPVKTWPHATQVGLTFEAENTAVGPSSGLGMRDQWGTLCYYDTVYAWYQAWLREDNCAPDSAYLAAARAVTDNHVATVTFGGMTYQSGVGFATAPRLSGLQGIMCRLWDAGRVEWWPSILAFVDFQRSIRLDRHRVGGPFETVPYEIREGGYTLMFLAWIAVLHPDAATRATYAELAISRAMDPVVRQLTTFATSPDRAHWFTTAHLDRDGNGLADQAGDGYVGGNNEDCAQPFINMLSFDGLVCVHRMMRLRGLTADPRYAQIGAAIVRAGEGWLANYLDAKDGKPLVRAPGYWAGRANHTDAFAAAQGGPITLKAPFVPVVGVPAPYGVADGAGDGSNPFLVDRQLLATGLGSICYASALAGNTLSWRQRIAERYDSAFARTDGRSSDFYAPGNQRNWNQHYRNCLRGPGWLLGGLEDFA